MQTGWVAVNGRWYYMNISGVMQTGWVAVKGSWYYLNASGAMQTGWTAVNGSWYYLNASGAMQTGLDSRKRQVVLSQCQRRDADRVADDRRQVVLLRL